MRLLFSKSLRNINSRYLRRTPCTTLNRSVTSLCFSKDGLNLASCSDDKKLSMYRLDSDSPLYAIENAHKDKIKSVIFMEENSIATGGYDSMVNVWDIRQKKVQNLEDLFINAAR